MNIFRLLKNNYFTLFVKREGKVVLGKSYSNLWLLVGVLVATFLAISFSNASLKYLSYKMDDPFINWVDMKSEFGEKESFKRLEHALSNEELKAEYHFDSYQSDFISSEFFCDENGDELNYFKIRFFDNFKTNRLVSAIMDDKNVVNGWKCRSMEELDDNTVGVVITEEALLKLGYKKATSYIYYHSYSADDFSSAEEYGFEMLGRDRDFTAVPVPVLGVVKRLPGNVDIIAGTYLYEQINNQNDYPFSMNKYEYGNSLNYYVPSSVGKDKFMDFLNEVIAGHPDSSYRIDDYAFWNNCIIPFTYDEDVCFISLLPDGYSVDYEEMKSINREILDKFGKNDVHRVFDYTFGEYISREQSFLSVNFVRLDRIRDFEQFVDDEFNITIEMTQINAKENFNAVSTMANILSWAIIVFAIVCIVLFIVNLLHSYFQKVKRNLGTFKAFGMGNRELISVYALIMIATVLVSIAISLSAVWILQGVLDFAGLTRDEVFGYLSLWSGKTIASILVIILASVYTVYAVMNKLLRSTPGDLIYDR